MKQLIGSESSRRNGVFFTKFIFKNDKTGLTENVFYQDIKPLESKEDFEVLRVHALSIQSTAE